MRRKYLFAKRNLYIKVLLLLGSLSFPALIGCSGQIREVEQKRIDDSIAAAKQAQEAILSFKKDSAETAIRQKSVNDSVFKADSVAKAKRKYKNNYYNHSTQPEYGVVRDENIFP